MKNHKKICLVGSGEMADAYATVCQKISRHCLSSVISRNFNNAKTFAKKYNIDATYSINEAEENDLSNIVKKIKNKSLSGVNVTLPYKQKIINNIDKIINDAQNFLKSHKLFPDYFELRDTQLETVKDNNFIGKKVLLASVTINKTRLIDNIEF